MYENDKYVVFKRREFTEWHDQYVSWEPPPPPQPLPDAIVIRRQDIFAGPGLSGYAAAIQTAIDLSEQADREGELPYRREVLQQLAELRDFFHEQAQMAFDHPNKKLPD